MVVWAVSGVALLTALVALGLGRRLARRLDAITQSYWELRYEYTRLRSRLSRLDPEEAGQAVPAEPPAPPPSVTFVPLSAIRKKDT